MGTKTHALGWDEFRRYVDALNRAEGRLLPYAAACAVIIGTGARVGEAVTLRDRDLFFPDGQPRPEITRTLEKKRGSLKRLTVAFPWEYLGSPVRRWRAAARERFLLRPDDPVFAVRYRRQPMNRVHVLRCNRELLAAAGINPRGVGLHGLRKTFLRAVYRQRIHEGDDMMNAIRHVQKLAGHARFETTLIYLMDEIEGSHRDTIQNVFSALFQNEQLSTSREKINQITSNTDERKSK